MCQSKKITINNEKMSQTGNTLTQLINNNGNYSNEVRMRQAAQKQNMRLWQKKNQQVKIESKNIESTQV